MYQEGGSLRNYFSENTFYPDSASSMSGITVCLAFCLKLRERKRANAFRMKIIAFSTKSFTTKHTSLFEIVFLSEDKMVTGKDTFKIGLLFLRSNATGNNVLPGELLIDVPET